MVDEAQLDLPSSRVDSWFPFGASVSELPVPGESSDCLAVTVQRAIAPVHGMRSVGLIVTDATQRGDREAAQPQRLARVHR